MLPMFLITNYGLWSLSTCTCLCVCVCACAFVYLSEMETINFSEYRIRLKNFKILGNGRELYRNVETTGSCPYNNEQTPSICDETLRIPVDNGDNINNITILVNSHTNDNNYPKDEKKAILTLCEVQIFASKLKEIIKHTYLQTILIKTNSIIKLKYVEFIYSYISILIRFKFLQHML